MSDDARLTRVLGAPPPIGLTALAAEDREQLASLIEQARDEHRVALDRAIEAGLGHLPRLLRGTVRSVLFR